AYADEVGRPSIDPIVLVKLMAAGALEGIGSARELCRGREPASGSAALPRLRLPRAAACPSDVFARADAPLRDGALFERLFLRSVALCCEHGLVEGTHLSVDGFHAEANAALASLRASLALVAGDEPGAEEPVDGESAPAEPAWLGKTSSMEIGQ
ncbi:MAG: hypothetical protein M3O77_02630, partial [Chloroflexota bacterium]|nr:hypothetical protein [Chloroflexota bacterium]